jgi:hypothetical protein
MRELQTGVTDAGYKGANALGNCSRGSLTPAFGLFTFDFPWLANPVYFAALLFTLVGWPRVDIYLCVPAIALGLLLLSTREWWFNEGSGTAMEKLGPAFYV